MANLFRKRRDTAGGQIAGFFDEPAEPTAAQSRRQQAPYQQSRGSLREKWGPRTIGGPATVSPRDMTLNGPRLAPADPNTGFTGDDKWNTFFKYRGADLRPPTPSQLGGAIGGGAESSTGNALGTATPASDSFRGRFGRNQQASEPTTPWSAAPAGSFAPTGYERPTTRPMPGASPGEFLQAAFDEGTSFWNKLGVPIPTPPAGAMQAGTSFRNKFGTGSVSTASEVARRRMMRKGTLV